MRPEEVPAELVEAAMWAVAGEQPACAECGENGPAACVYCKDEAEKYARDALAAVLPEIQAQALRGAALHLRDIADEMDAARPGNLLVGASVEATRQDANILDQIAARMTATTEGTTT